MRQYRQLTEDNRIEIDTMKQAGKTQTYIVDVFTPSPLTTKIGTVGLLKKPL